MYILHSALLLKVVLSCPVFCEFNKWRKEPSIGLEHHAHIPLAAFYSVHVALLPKIYSIYMVSDNHLHCAW